MSFCVLIPARLASTRLPDKPLADIGGVPMVVRVAQRASASCATRVVVAADHAVIVQACSAHGIGALPEPRPLRHVGIYGYRAGFLRQFPQLSQAPIEVAEALEQLRALWHGHRIAVHVTETAPGIGVDTPEDLERVRALWRQAV